MRGRIKKTEALLREELKRVNERYADELRDQLKQRELNKFYEARRIEEESDVINNTVYLLTNTYADRKMKSKCAFRMFVVTLSRRMH